MLRFRSISTLFVGLVLCCAAASAQSSASFTTKTFSAGHSARNLYSVDVNNDGIPDLVEDSLDLPNTISVMIANGDGTFQAPRTIYTFPTSYQGTTPMVAGDFNGDGNADLVFALAGTQQLAVFLGNGDGTFQAPKFETMTMEDLPGGQWFGGGPMATADFDHDGHLDVIAEVSGSTSQSLYMMWGDGTGNFQAIGIDSFLPNSVVESVSVGDFDGDGNTDFAEADGLNCTSSGCPEEEMAVLYGGGDRSGFSGSVIYRGAPFTFASGDVNGDGRTDLFGVGGAGNQQLIVMTAQPQRAFTTFTMTAGVTLSGTIGTAVPVVMGDFNGDGNMDLATLGYDGTTGVFAVFLANGSGGYQLQTVDVGSPQSATNVVTGDFNRDERPDLATVWYNTPTPAPTLTVALNTTSSGHWSPCAYPAKGEGIVLCSPGSTAGSSVQFSASANSFGLLHKMELWVDGSKLAEQHHVWENRGWFSLNTTLSSGMHRVVIFAADIGNRLQKYATSIQVGSGAGCNAPSAAGVDLCTPASGATVSSPVQVTAAGTVTGTLKSMELWVDGVKKYAESSSPTLQTSISVSAGQHRFAVLAENTAGQVWEKAVNATVQASGSCGAPSSAGVNLCSPTSGANVSSPVQVQAAANVNGQFAQMELWVDGVKKFSETNSTVLNLSVSLGAGVHRIAVLALNTSGQKWEQVVNATVQ